MKIKSLLLLSIITLLATLFISCEKENNIYTVTFDYQTVEIEDFSDEVEENNKITEPDKPVWPGYNFIGWYKNTNFDAESRWVFSVDTVDKDLILYAKWEEVIEELEVIKTQKTFLEGTDIEFDVYKYETNKEGPTIFILGGIHGDERAGWHAATQMLDYDFKRGTIYILPVANGKAAKMNPPRRHFGQDLNRTFPGKLNGSKTEKLSYYIYEAIKNANPDLVLDLHESRRSYQEGLLGNSIILHDALYSLFLNGALNKINNLEVMAGKLTFRMDNNPPKGSINYTFTENENVPVMTIETTRGYYGSIENETVPLEQRIKEQIAIIEVIIDEFEVIK